ncbi:hypothetical protein RNAN_2079 [Rheinheimera nanhaiensis E407-8]|uniref:Uncharacterized protein n=1 Tax=Rheinheimera nanhaiensis E407-8 TaxID=562729 RepID=I1DYG1_9GAMM|nr:hypothetical protein RNAN_2079 [Rheinheimera nanhaiensis E407-8]
MLNLLESNPSFRRRGFCSSGVLAALFNLKWIYYENHQ